MRRSHNSPPNGSSNKQKYATLPKNDNILDDDFHDHAPSSKNNGSQMSSKAFPLELEDARFDESLGGFTTDSSPKSCWSSTCTACLCLLLIIGGGLGGTLWWIQQQQQPQVLDPRTYFDQAGKENEIAPTIPATLAPMAAAVTPQPTEAQGGEEATTTAAPTTLPPTANPQPKEDTVVTPSPTPATTNIKEETETPTETSSSTTPATTPHASQEESKENPSSEIVLDNDEATNEKEAQSEALIPQKESKSQDSDNNDNTQTPEIDEETEQEKEAESHALVPQDEAPSKTSSSTTTTPESTSSNANNANINTENEYWELIATLEGTQAQVRFGSALSLSADGSMIGIAAVPEIERSQDRFPTCAYIFELKGIDSNNHGTYEKLGQSCTSPKGKTPMGNVLMDVSLNVDGTIYATATRNEVQKDSYGDVRVYQYNATSQLWDRRGQLIPGEAARKFGAEVELSDDGTRLATRVAKLDPTTNHSTTQLQSYRYNEEQQHWKLEGTMETEAPPQISGGFAGKTLSMTADGNTIAHGVPQRFDDGIPDVRVFYQFEDDEAWALKGKPFLAASKDVQGFAESVVMNADGEVLAIGDTQLSSDEGTGMVQVYWFDRVDESWQPMGGPLQGLAPGDEFGHAVALSKDGQTLAVGARWSNVNGTNSGQVHTFAYDSGAKEWRPLGTPFAGPGENAWFGDAVALSQDGTMLAAAANTFGKDRHGQVQIFRKKSINQARRLLRGKQ